MWLSKRHLGVKVTHGPRERRTIALFPPAPIPTHDPSELSISARATVLGRPRADNGTVKAFCWRTLRRQTPAKSITFKMQPKRRRRRLSSQPERITQVTVIYSADPLFFVLFFSLLFTLPSATQSYYRRTPSPNKIREGKKTNHYVNVNRATLPFPTINPAVREPNIFVINYRLLREVNKLLSTPHQYSRVACLNIGGGEGLS